MIRHFAEFIITTNNFKKYDSEESKISCFSPLLSSYEENLKIPIVKSGNHYRNFKKLPILRYCPEHSAEAHILPDNLSRNAHLSRQSQPKRTSFQTISVEPTALPDSLSLTSRGSRGKCPRHPACTSSEVPGQDRIHRRYHEHRSYEPESEVFQKGHPIPHCQGRR